MHIVIIKYKNPYLQPIMQYFDRHLAQIIAVAPDAHVTVIENDQKVINTYLPEADILISSPMDYQNQIDLAQAKKLKWAHLSAAGASDVAAILKSTDILLTNSSGVHPIPIAEHVFTYILMFSRCLNISYRNQLSYKKWEQGGLAVNIREVSNSTIGIVGFGRIGKQIATLAKGFNMKVVVLSHTDKSRYPGVDAYYEKGQIGELLKVSDYVVNALPLTEETKHFFTLSLFKQMKPTSYFVNIGRGKTVVEQDLITAVKDGIIHGAGLDVFDEEPLSESSELWSLDNVILTPHYAGWTPRYIDRVIDIFCENLKAYLQGSPMPTLVDKEKGY